MNGPELIAVTIIIIVTVGLLVDHMTQRRT